MVKNLPADAEDARDTDLIPGLERFPQRRAWQPTAVFLPRESQGQRNLRSNCQHPLDHGKSKRVPEKHLLLLSYSVVSDSV